MIRIYVVRRCKKIDNARFTYLKSIFSKKELSLLPKFGTKNYSESFLSKALLKYFLSGLINIPPRKIIISKTKKGKPIIDKPILHNFDVSLSHSNGTIAVAINTDGRIGVDVEIIKQIDLDLILSFFPQKLKEHISNLTVLREKRTQLYKIWTLTESYFKAIGSGLGNNFPEIKMTTHNRYVTFVKKSNPKGKFYFSSYMRNNFIISICSSTRIPYKYLDKNLIIIEEEKELLL